MATFSGEAMFDRLRNAITTLERCARELQVECLEGSDAAELVDVVGRGERVCGAMKTLLAQRVAETGVWRDGGSRDAAVWLSQQTGTTIGAAQQALDTARALGDLPATEAAFRSGELSGTQAAEIAAAAREAPDAEGALLETARSTDLQGLRDTARVVRADAQADDEAWAATLATGIARGHTEPGERCELAGGVPIPVATARKLLQDASVSLLVRDGHELTAVGRPVRTIPAKLRRELETTYPACGVDGCSNDRFLEIDHVVPVCEGGATSKANTWRLCPHHHFLKHHRRWRVVGEPGHWDLAPGEDPRGPP